MKKVIGTVKELIPKVTTELLNLNESKKYNVEIKEYRAKRSLDSNAYCWVLLEKIAQAIKSSKDEVYLEMLKKYGRFTFVVIDERAVDKFCSEWREHENLGKVKVNGKEGIQLKLYYGSSTYNTKEMARFIDGIVSEAELLGIETITPNKISKYKKSMGSVRNEVNYTNN